MQIPSDHSEFVIERYPEGPAQAIDNGRRAWDTVTSMTNTTRTKPVRRGARGEYAKTRERRKAILDAALEVFAEGGYRSGSLREVAQRVGISEAGLLHHFSSKVKLLEAVLTHRDDRALEMVPMRSEDGAATMRGLVALAAHNASIPGVVELYCTLSAEATSPEHPAHQYFVDRYDITRSNIERALEFLRAEGRLRPGMTPYRGAVAIIAMMDGLQVQWLLDRSVVDMEIELREFISGFVDIDWDIADEAEALA